MLRQLTLVELLLLERQSAQLAVELMTISLFAVCCLQDKPKPKPGEAGQRGISGFFAAKPKPGDGKLSM